METSNIYQHRPYVDHMTDDWDEEETNWRPALYLRYFQAVLGHKKQNRTQWRYMNGNSLDMTTHNQHPSIG